MVVVASIPRAVAAQGDPLGPEFRVNTYTADFQTHAALASDSSGHFVVIWESKDQDGSGRGVFGQRYDNSGAPLGPEFRVNTYTTSTQRAPAVASDSSGNFVVVWESYQDGGTNVFGQRYDRTGEPLGPEFRVNTYTASEQGEPAVASDSSGNFLVVWESDGVFGQVFASSGAPLGREFRVNTTTNGFEPAVASDSSGNFVVVWETYQNGSKTDVFGRICCSSTGALGHEFRVNTYTTNWQRLPNVASDSSGNFVVVWMSDAQDGADWAVFGQRYNNSGEPLGPEFRVDKHTKHFRQYPDVASDPSGNFVVVWESYHDGSGTGVFAQRYDSSGAPLGREFRVNTYTTNGFHIPAVASDSSGNFAVVWQSSLRSIDIFGQRCSQIVPSPSWREPAEPVEP